MEKSLAQIEIKSLFKKQKIKIFGDRIMIFKKSLTNLLEYEIGLDEIEHKKTIKSETNNNLMALGFLASVFGLIFNALGAT